MNGNYCNTVCEKTVLSLSDSLGASVQSEAGEHAWVPSAHPVPRISVAVLSQDHRRDDCNFVVSLEINPSASFSTLFWLTPFAFLYRI